jgi:hypothetical protein
MIQIPSAIDGPSAWYGPAIAHRSDWVESLSSAELDEIESAGRQLALAERDWATLNQNDFPLPRLNRRLERVLDEVLEGRGFVLLRGLPVERWGRRLTAVAFLGMGLHWGRLR